MTSLSNKLRNNILRDNEAAVIELLHSGVDSNYEGGWPVRLAARHGAYSIVKALIQCGANPHLLSESGASTLQLAVFSGKHWETDKWTFLLSCCDSSQLADGAAVAIVFHNILALTKILETGRCNTNIPTSLTGKTVEDLAKGYKLHYMLNTPVAHSGQPCSGGSDAPGAGTAEYSTRRQHRPATRSTLTPPQPHRNLSPSVARFFNQTANLTTLSPSRRTIMATFSPSLAE